MTLRGPDDHGEYVDERTGVALGARRLSIIDVAGGHQPVCNEDGTIWSALNGEVYNHPALQRDLRAKGHALASGVDTEVLVHLYEESGSGIVDRVEGMYAFAIWDSRREQLLLVRDRFGEKPLFYAEVAGELAFASELDALLEGLDGGLDVDPAVVDDFFVFGYVPGPRSIARGVRQLAPGHLLRWSRRTRRIEVEQYWRPPTHPQGRRATADFQDLVGEAESLLEAAVRSRLIADVPLGVFLSGGTDSTLIAALAARVSDHQVKTFTVGYDVGTVSEAAEARRTAAEIGADHHELVLTEQELAERVPGLLAGLDQPLADQALISLHAIAERARQDVTVAVGGEGADELFGGYPRYRWLARAEKFGAVAPPRAASSLAALTRRLPHRRAGRVADLIDPEALLVRHLDWVTAGRRACRSRFYGPALAGCGREQLPGDLDARLNGAANASVTGRLMVLDQLLWLPDDVLMKADRAGMRVSMEIRTAYLSREVAQFAATVPAELHTSGHGKALLRALLARVAPQAVRARPKTAFRVPAAEWLRGPLAPLMERQVATGSAYSEGWFDAAQTGQLFADHRRGALDASDVLWPMLAFGLWLDRMRGTVAAT